MASNENFQSHFSPQNQKPPSPSLKTHPTRRRIIRKSPRHSIRLTTLRKASTVSPGNDPTQIKTHSKDSPLALDHDSTLQSFDFDPLGLNSLKKVSTGGVGDPGGLGGGLGADGALLRLFSCLGCSLPLRQPVTLECGHTCCRECGVAKCPECGGPVEKVACVNVLVRSIVCKLIGEDLRERDRVTNTDESTLPKKSNFFHPYNLRYRHAGKHKKVSRTNPKNTNDSNLDTYSKKKLSLDTLDTLEAPIPSLPPTELECVLCCRWLRSPVTTRCGHTFCRGCLDRVLDHGLGCPLCMGRLSPGHHHTRPSTSLLQECVRRMCPDEGDDTEKDTQVPVFICTSAFPGVACPLYVYEPRYRLLTRRCLQSSTRRFAMAASTGSTHTAGGDRFAPFGTMLEVRDAVHLRDGRSILTTVGLRRFRVVERGEKDGYDTATIEYIRDAPVSQNQVPSLRALHERVHRKAARWVRSLAPHVQAEIEQSLGAMPPVEPDWASLPDGPSWAWWLMPVLPLSSQLQVGFLSTTSLEKRLRAIEKMLERMSVRMRALKRQDMCARTEENVETCGNNGSLVQRDRPGVEL